MATVGGSGTFTVIALGAMTDSGTGTDALSIVRQTESASDSGHLTEQMTVIVLASVSDGGTGSDGPSEASPGGSYQATDSGTGTDALSVAFFQMLGDSAIGISAEVVTRTDTGTGASVSGVFVQDFAAGSDVLSATILAGLLDAGTGSEIMAALGSGGGVLLISISDSGTGSDGLSAPAQTQIGAFWWD